MTEAAARMIETTRKYWEHQMASLTLSREELQDLTHKQKSSAQVRALRAMGIEHKVRADGTVVVLRSHIEAQLGGAPQAANQPSWQPDWDAA